LAKLQQVKPGAFFGTQCMSVVDWSPLPEIESLICTAAALFIMHWYGSQWREP